MNHFKYLLKVFSLCFLLSTTACADSPESPVSGTSGDNSQQEEGQGQETSENLTAMAVKYEGRDTQGRTCDFFVTIMEEEGDHSAHAHSLALKMNYTTLDGHKPHAGEAQFYLYDSSNGTYYPEDSNKPNTTLSLLSVSLKDPDLVADPNLINDYIANVELDQYLRVEFNQNADVELFEEALESVLAGGTTLEQNLDVFSSVQLLSMGTAHGDHYHFPACLNFAPVSVEETLFELAGHDHDEEEDHDLEEDHDHDNDHDHDHGH